MSVASFVLACALDLMGRSAARLPPIILVSERPADSSPQAVAFVRHGERAIYLIESSAPFQAAIESNRNTHGCRDLDRLRLMASVIAHEDWHLRNGPDETQAYYAQLIELQRLGSGPGRWPYETVRRAMIETRKRTAAQTRAARQFAASAITVREGPIPTAASASDRPWPRGAPESSQRPGPRR